MIRVEPAAVRSAAPLQLDIDRRVALVGGHAIPLTDKEYAILELLVLAGGRSVTDEALASRLFGAVLAPRPIITFHICRLLKKLTGARTRALIGTTWSGGHALIDARPPNRAPLPAGVPARQAEADALAGRNLTAWAAP